MENRMNRFFPTDLKAWLSSEFRFTYSPREWGIWIFHRKICNAKTMNHSLPTHRVDRWETFVTCSSVSVRTLIIENDKDKNNSDKKVDENYSRILGGREWCMHMPLSLMQTSVPVNAHSGAARKYLCFTNRPTYLWLGEGHIQRDSSWTSPSSMVSLFGQVRYSVMFLHSLF